MAIDYKAIADDVAANNGGTVDGADYLVEFARMSAETVGGGTNIETAKIKQYLILMDKWLPIKNSVADEAVIAIDALNIFDTFDITNPVTGSTVLTKLTAILDALVTAALISAIDKDAILAMGVSPKWPGLTPGNVQTAIGRRLKGAI